LRVIESFRNKLRAGESDNNRRAKFYRLTKSGMKQVEAETEQWARIALAMTNALRAT
jgi:PadR family transcriptional regulator PadR